MSERRYETAAHGVLTLRCHSCHSPHSLHVPDSVAACGPDCGVGSERAALGALVLQEPEEAVAAAAEEEEEEESVMPLPSDAELLASGATLVRSREELLAACEAGGVVVLADDAVIELSQNMLITTDTTISGGGAIRGKLLRVKGCTLILRGIECQGLVTNGSARLEAREVRVLNSESQGIYVGSGTTASIEGGSVDGSRDDGVYVGGTDATVSLSRVAISNSGSNGIRADYNGSATARGCTVSSSGGQDYREENGGTIERLAAAPAPAPAPLSEEQLLEGAEARRASALQLLEIWRGFECGEASPDETLDGVLRVVRQLAACKLLNACCSCLFFLLTA